MTAATSWPLLWDADARTFRPIRDVLPDLAEWGKTSPERVPPRQA